MKMTTDKKLRILITGGNGFIGRNLATYLSRGGHEVVGIGHGSMQPKTQEKLGFSVWINGDIDFGNLQHLSTRIGSLDAIIHLAGGSHVGKSFEAPSEDFHRTVVTGNQLLDWVRLSSSNTPVVLASSAAVYGAGHDGPIQEDAKQNPYSPYGTHKALLESLAISYSKNFGLKTAIVRLFSVYGNGLEKQLVFDVSRRLTESNISELRMDGSGNELRDWLHINDVCELLKHLIPLASHDPFIVNGGNGSPVSVATIVHTLAGFVSDKIEIQFSGNVRPGDPFSLVACTKKLQQTGYKTKMDLTEGLQQTFSWYRSITE